MLLGEILIEKYNVKPVDIDKALQFQIKFGGMLGSVLVNMGIVDEETIVLALSDQLGVRILRDKNKTEQGFKKFIFEKGINVSFLLLIFDLRGLYYAKSKKG